MRLWLGAVLVGGLVLGLAPSRTHAFEWVLVPDPTLIVGEPLKPTIAFEVVPMPSEVVAYDPTLDVARSIAIQWHYVELGGGDQVVAASFDVRPSKAFFYGEANVAPDVCEFVVGAYITIVHELFPGVFIPLDAEAFSESGLPGVCPGNFPGVSDGIWVFEFADGTLPMQVDFYALSSQGESPPTWVETASAAVVVSVVGPALTPVGGTLLVALFGLGVLALLRGREPRKCHTSGS